MSATIRRTLTALGAVALLTLTACQGGANDEQTAVDFMTAYAAGDGAAMCELAAEDILDCEQRSSAELSEDPEAVETFEAPSGESRAVVVEMVYAETSETTDRWAVELNGDGKVIEYEDMSGEPATEESVAYELGWS